jgi:hypothetical protein
MAREQGTVHKTPEHTGHTDIVRIELPGGVTLSVSSMDRLAFYAGIGVLAVAGIMDWPVATVLIVGHALADTRHSELLREFGSALEEA